MTDKVTLNTYVNTENATSLTTGLNSDNATIIAAFDNTLSRNGTAPNQMEATLDMNSNHIINLPSPSSISEPVTLNYFNNYITTGQGVTGLTGVPVSTAMQPVVNASTIAAAQTLLGITTSGGGGGGGGGSSGRTRLTAATTFYVSTAGSDITGTGTLANPWATRTHAYTTLQSSYDLAGFVVTIQLANGVYTDSLQATGPCVGQIGAGGIIFTGNATDATQVTIRPAANTGYAFSAAFGAAYSVQYFTIDMINSAADGIVVGQQSQMNIGYSPGTPTSVGTAPSMIFLSPHGANFNNVSCAFGASVSFTGNISLRPSTYTTTASWSSSSTTVTLASVSGITPGQFMGIEGAGIGPTPGLYSNTGALTETSSNYITSVTGNTATLGMTTGSSGSGVIVQLTAGGQAFLDVGGGSSVYFNTNGEPLYSMFIDLNGYPFYSSGFIYGQGNSYNNCQGLTFIRGSQGRGPAFQCKGIAAIDTGLQGVPYLPGWAPLIQGVSSFSSGANTLTLGSASQVAIGNTINSYANATVTFSAGATVIPATANTGIIAVGMEVTGPGIVGGTTVTAYAGGNMTLSFPTSSAQTGQVVFFTGGVIANGTVVTFVSGNTVSLSNPTTAAGSSSTVVAISGIVLTGSQYI